MTFKPTAISVELLLFRLAGHSKIEWAVIWDHDWPEWERQGWRILARNPLHEQARESAQ